MSKFRYDALALVMTVSGTALSQVADVAGQAPASAPAIESGPAPTAPSIAESEPSAVSPAVPANPPAAPAPKVQAAPAPKPAEPYEGPPLLLGHEKHHVGGYGGVTVAYTHMLRHDGVLIGGQGGVLLDHRLTLGGAGYGFTRTPSGPARADGTPQEYSTGYGGFLIRYAAYTNFPVYASLGLLVGAGGIVLATDHNYDDPDDDDDDDDWDDDVETRGYFVAQPDLTLHVNATRWFRFGVTFGYRFTSPVDEFDYDAADVGGVVTGGNVEFGWF